MWYLQFPPCLQKRQVLPAGPSAETASTMATTTAAAGWASPSPRPATRARRWDTWLAPGSSIPCAAYQGYFLGKNEVPKWGWALHIETGWELHFIRFQCFGS